MTKKAPPILNLFPATLPLGHVRVHVSFGVSDARGRVMGAEISISHKPAKGLGPDGPALPERYVVWPHATRDGACWGPNPRRSCGAFATYAEARAHAERYVAAAFSRASKTP